MYTLMLKQEFIAQHFLIGKDIGKENFEHSHHYSFEVEIESQYLDQHNYIIDIVEVKSNLDELLSHFDDKLLNDLPEFHHQNPSLELFSKILWQKCHGTFKLPEHCRITVRLWEDAVAKASYRELNQCESV